MSIIIRAISALVPDLRRHDLSALQAANNPPASIRYE